MASEENPELEALSDELLDEVSGGRGNVVSMQEYFAALSALIKSGNDSAASIVDHLR
jgi:hypothetical protein